MDVKIRASESSSTAMNTNELLGEDILKNKDNQIEALTSKNIQFQREIIKLTQKLIYQTTSLSPAKSNTNTSSNFPLTSDFSKLWETFSTVDILDFVEFEEEHIVLFHLIQEMFLISTELIHQLISMKYKQFTGILHLPQNDDFLKQIEQSTKGLIKEHVDNIFNNEEEQLHFFEAFMLKYKLFFNETLSPKPSEQLRNVFNEIINTKEFKLMLNNVKKIIIFIELNDKEMHFPIEDYSKRKIILKEYLPSRNYVFREQCQSLNIGIVLLNPPLTKSGFPLTMGIRPIVIPIQEKEIAAIKAMDNVVLEKEEKGEKGGEPKASTEDNAERYDTDISAISPIALDRGNSDAFKPFNKKDEEQNNTTGKPIEIHKNFNPDELCESHFNVNILNEEPRRSVIIKKMSNTFNIMNDFSSLPSTNMNNYSNNSRQNSGTSFIHTSPLNSDKKKTPYSSRANNIVPNPLSDKAETGTKEDNFAPINTEIKAQVCLKNFRLLNPAEMNEYMKTQPNHAQPKENIHAPAKNSKEVAQKPNQFNAKDIKPKKARGAYQNYLNHQNEHLPDKRKKETAEEMIGRSKSKPQISVPIGNFLFNNYNMNIREISKNKEKAKKDFSKTGNLNNYNKKTYEFNNNSEAIQFISGFKKKSVIIKIKQGNRVEALPNESLQQEVVINDTTVDDNIIHTEGNSTRNSTNNLRMNKKKIHINNTATARRNTIVQPQYSLNSNNNAKANKKKPQTPISFIKLAKMNTTSNKNLDRSTESQKHKQKQKCIPDNTTTYNLSNSSNSNSKPSNATNRLFSNEKV